MTYVAADSSGSLFTTEKMAIYEWSQVILLLTKGVLIYSDAPRFAELVKTVFISKSYHGISNFVQSLQ